MNPDSPLLRPDYAPATRKFHLSASYGHLVTRASDEEIRTGCAQRKRKMPLRSGEVLVTKMPYEAVEDFLFVAGA